MCASACAHGKTLHRSNGQQLGQQFGSDRIQQPQGTCRCSPHTPHAVPSRAWANRIVGHTAARQTVAWVTRRYGNDHRERNTHRTALNGVYLEPVSNQRSADLGCVAVCWFCRKPPALQHLQVHAWSGFMAYTPHSDTLAMPCEHSEWVTSHVA